MLKDCLKTLTHFSIATRLCSLILMQFLDTLKVKTFFILFQWLFAHLPLFLFLTWIFAMSKTKTSSDMQSGHFFQTGHIYQFFRFTLRLLLFSFFLIYWTQTLLSYRKSCTHHYLMTVNISGWKKTYSNKMYATILCPKVILT